MGAALFISLGIICLLSIPIITARMANRLGRNPWIWFGVSLVLPLIATIILAMLPDLSEEK